MRTVPTQYDLDTFLTTFNLRSYGIKAVRGCSKTGPYIKLLIPSSCEYLVSALPETNYGGADIFVEIVS